MNETGRQVALVTGTSSGMGLHAAVELARRGLSVVATMRDVSRSDRLTAAAEEAGVELDLRPLDVTDHEAARACVDGVLADHGRLDELVNNAGRGAVGTAEQLGLDEIRDQLEVNYLGPVALTKLVLPTMRAAGSGRVITVTSVGGAVGQPFADAYCGAKFAVEGFMQSLSTVMLAHGVWVSVIEPAAVASDFVSNVARPAAGVNAARDGGDGGDGGDAAGGDAYAAQLDAYLSRSAGAFAAAQSAHDAGVAIAAAVTSSDYRFRWQTSDGATAFVGMSLADLDGSRVLGATRTWIETPN
jgi:short-subunit dehydrogenase